MELFRKLFSETAAVIDESKRGAPATLSEEGATDTDILTLLTRRPCTIRDISSGLGLHPEDAAKRLHILSQQGAVVSVRRNDVIFYEAVRGKHDGRD